MKAINTITAVILITILVISPVIDVMALEHANTDHVGWEVFALSEKVGYTVDDAERIYFQLFPATRHFRSAVFLRSTDGTIAVLIAEEVEGLKTYDACAMDKEAFEALRQRVDRMPEMDVTDGTDTSSSDESWKIVTVSEKVGETIDLAERNRYNLFLFSQTFHSAVVLQSPGSVTVAFIAECVNEEKKYRTKTITAQTLEKLRGSIDGTAALNAPLRSDLLLRSKEFDGERGDKFPMIGMITLREIKEEVELLAKEKWTDERWRNEERSDSGPGYRVAGTMFGFTLGAAAGMLIGKGFQGKKVERQIYHQGEWGDTWTEDIYSYEHKHAPHWGAVIGGVAGGTTGYILGKRADKKYYLYVPKEIRMHKTKSSGLGNVFFGFALVGPVIGGIAGATLYTPASGKEGETDFGGGAFIGGYLWGAISGITMISAAKNRATHTCLWEKSFRTNQLGSFLNVELMPVDPMAFNLNAGSSPAGDTFLEYKMDIFRLRF